VTKPRALVVDDEPDIRELLGITLERMNLDVTTADTIGAATRELRGATFDLCLTDMRLPDGDGLDIVEWIQTHKPQTPVAVITAHGNVETAVRALKLGAFDFISKPLDVAALRKLIAATLKLGESSESTLQLPQVKLLGRSRAMEQLREMIERVARSQAPVHIYGESGTGKELVAHLIHDAGARRDGPFVPVNCGAIPTELMESELFGHKKGSFTGAIADKQGLIQSAEGGTLFLDELADLPLHMQVKLLRVIQEKSVRPVGEAKEIPIDVRILSATHKNLAALVAEGKFREDLFYRLNVFTIYAPPLRERKPDIMLLADHFLEKYAVEHRKHIKRISTPAIDMLTSYHWPGNVRELENTIERAVLVCEGSVIHGHHLPPTLQTAEASDTVPRMSLAETVGSFESDLIQDALKTTRGNRARAAKLLQTTERILGYKIQKYEIDCGRFRS